MSRKHAINSTARPSPFLACGFRHYFRKVRVCQSFGFKIDPAFYCKWLLLFTRDQLPWTCRSEAYNGRFPWISHFVLQAVCAGGIPCLVGMVGILWPSAQLKGLGVPMPTALGCLEAQRWPKEALLRDMRLGWPWLGDALKNVLPWAKLAWKFHICIEYHRVTLVITLLSHSEAYFELFW